MQLQGRSNSRDDSDVQTYLFTLLTKMELLFASPSYLRLVPIRGAMPVSRGEAFGRK